jgi:tetratricopeptide (TPR) repeat protein
LAVDPNHAGALELLKQLDDDQQRAVPGNLTLAKELHQRGQIAEAENVYRAILTAQPKHFDAAYLLGVIFLQQRKFQAAERQIGLAIGLQPKIAAAHYNRGVALMYLDRQEEALASFNSAIALKPDYDLAITQRDNIIETTGRIRSDRNR